MKFIHICRNPHEPFFWDSDKEKDICPASDCEQDIHETYVLYDEELKEQLEDAWKYKDLCD